MQADLTSEQIAALKAENTRQVDSQPQVPQVDGQTATPEPPESQVTPEAVAATTEPEPKIEAVNTPEKVNSDEKPEIELQSWDADDITGTPAQTPQVVSTFDFTRTGSAIGWEGVKDEKDFVSRVTDLQAQVKTLQENPLQGVPEDFREALEIAKKSPEAWKSYLSQQVVDFTQIDPLKLYEDEFIGLAAKNPRYQKDGKFDIDLAYQDMENIPLVQQELFGRQIQQDLIQKQRQQQEAIRAKAEARRVQAETSLAQATQRLSESLPFEEYGIKFEPKHSVGVYTGITDSSLTQKHFGKGVTFDKLVAAGFDMKEVSRTIAMAEYGDKMIKFSSKNAETKAKKAILDKTQHPKLDNAGTVVTPENPATKVVPMEDRLKAYYDKLRVNPFA